MRNLPPRYHRHRVLPFESLVGPTGITAREHRREDRQTLPEGPAIYDHEPRDPSMWIEPPEGPRLAFIGRYSLAFTSTVPPVSHAGRRVFPAASVDDSLNGKSPSGGRSGRRLEPEYRTERRGPGPRRLRLFPPESGDHEVRSHFGVQHSRPPLAFYYPRA